MLDSNSQKLQQSLNHVNFMKMVKIKLNLTQLTYLTFSINKSLKQCFVHIPSSIIAVVTFLPVIPWSHAACTYMEIVCMSLFNDVRCWVCSLASLTFKSNLTFPPFWPVFRKYHCNGKYGSVGILLELSSSLSFSTG